MLCDRKKKNKNQSFCLKSENFRPIFFASINPYIIMNWENTNVQMGIKTPAF